MLNIHIDSKRRKEINLLISQIANELIEEFHKSQHEAMKLIKESKVEKSLIEDKMGFHESPYNWAISVLTDHDDHEALDKYLYH